MRLADEEEQLLESYLLGSVSADIDRLGESEEEVWRTHRTGNPDNICIGYREFVIFTSNLYLKTALIADLRQNLEGRTEERSWESHILGESSGAYRRHWTFHSC